MSNSCTECGNPLSNRPNARYCSPACRQRAYRNRHSPTPASRRGIPTRVTAALAEEMVDLAEDDVKDMMAEAVWKLIAPQMRTLFHEMIHNSELGTLEDWSAEMEEIIREDVVRESG